MNKLKKTLAIFLAVVMILGSSVSIMAAFAESGTFKSETRFFRYDGSDWVETTKVKPGETIKARVYFTTSYVAAEQFVLYMYNKDVITPDKTKFTEASDPGWYNLIPNPDETYISGGDTSFKHKGTWTFGELDPSTDDLTEYAYLIDDWGLDSSVFDDYGMLKIWADGGVTEQFDGSTWVYEFYFKVKDDAPADAAATMLLPVEGRYTVEVEGSENSYTNVPQVSDTEVEGIEISSTNGTNKQTSRLFIFNVENLIPDGIDDLAESQGDSAADYSANTQFTYGGKSAVSSYVTLGGDVDVTFNVTGDDNYEEVVTLPYGDDIAGNEPAYTVPFGYDFEGWPVDGNDVTVDNDGNYQATNIVNGQEVTGSITPKTITATFYTPAGLDNEGIIDLSEVDPDEESGIESIKWNRSGNAAAKRREVSVDFTFGETALEQPYAWDYSDLDTDNYYFKGWAAVAGDPGDLYDGIDTFFIPTETMTVYGIYDADTLKSTIDTTSIPESAYVDDGSGNLALYLMPVFAPIPTETYTVVWKYYEVATPTEATPTEATLATMTDVVPGTTVIPPSTNTDPAVPEVEGYTFKWYTDAARETEAAAADYTINADTTFYGKYTINTHTVTYKYVSSETDVLPSTQTDAEYNSVVDLTPPAVDGYFIPADSEPVIEPALLAGNKMPDSDVTVTFNYKANPKLSWLVNDEALKEDQVAPKSTITDAMAPAATEIDAALDGTGKYFDSWSSYPATMPETDVSVEAVLKDEEYTFKFVDNQDYDVTNNTADTPVKATDTYSALPVPANVPEGYSFAGYQDVNDPSKVYDPVNDGGTLFGDLGNNGDEITVKPLFTANDYSIVYYDSDNATALATVTEPYGTTITDPAVSVTAKEGYTFQNSWTYKTDAGVDCDPQPTTFPAENLKAYPDFEINTYKYIFVDEKFSTVTPDIEAEYNDDIATPTDPSYEGWTFAGWYSDQTLENKYTFPAKMPALGDGSDGQTMTLYAKWNPVLVDINITFDADGGTFTDGNTGTYTATAGATWTDAVPTYNVVNYAAEGLSKPGYALTGWKVNGGSAITAFPSVYPDADTTYTAVWRARSVTVKYLVAPDATSLDDIDFSDTAALDAMTVRSAGVPYGTTGYQIISYTGDDGAVEKWTVKVDGAPAEYAPLSTVDIVAPLVTLNASGIPETLYFVALSVNPEMYNITFDANGGYFDGDENKVTKIATVSDGETPTCNDPVWPGHTFIDWDPAVVPATGDTTYKALWETKEYTIIYKNNYDETDDSDYESATVTDPIELPQDPDREGYEFLGWFTDRDGTAGNEFDEDYALPDDNTAPIEVYAKWEIQKYEITYDANGGEFVGTPTNPVAATFGDALPTEPEVTREGYTPDGWVYKDADAATYTDATMPAEDLTATVQWKLKTFTVTFDPDNGDPEIEMPDQPYGEDIAVPRSPSKEGYDFDKWVDADGKTPEDYNNDAGMPDVEDLSFTATYIAKEYPVKFIDDGNTVAEEDRAFGEKFDDLAPTYTPEKTGYTFGGWNTADDGTGTAYDSSLTVPVGGYTFYAVYTPNTYKINYEKNDGTWTDTSAEDYDVFTYGETVDVRGEDDITKEHYAFKEVSFDAAGENIFDGNWTQIVSRATRVSDGEYELTVYVQWDINKWSITYDPGEGTLDASVVNPITEIAYDTVLSTLGADPEPTAPEGRSFDAWEWYDKDNNKLDSKPANMPDGNLKAVAKYTANPYTIKFEEKGGTEVADITLPYGETITVPQAPTKTGYSFGGWFEDEGLTTAYSFPEKMPVYGTPDDPSITVYAKWDPANTTYSIKVYLQDVDDPDSYSEADNSPIENVPGTTEAELTRDDIATIAGIPAGFKVSDNSDPTFTVPAENGEYALYLDRISYKVSYAFKDTDGNVIDAAEATKTDAEVVFEGEIDTTYPEIPDYEYVSNDAPDPAIMPANDITVTFTYKKTAIVKLVAKEGTTTMVERDGIVEMNEDKMPTSTRRPYTVSEIIPVDRDTYEYDNSDSQTFSRWFITGLDFGISGDDFGDWVEVTGGGHYELERLKGGIVRTSTIVKVYDRDNNLVEMFYVVIYGDITLDGYRLSDDSSKAESELINRQWDPANNQIDYLKTKAGDISSFDGALLSDDVEKFEKLDIDQDHRKIDQQLGRVITVQ